MGPPSLPHVPAPGHYVRHRPGLSVFRAASPAGWPHAQRLAALAEHDGDQCWHRGCRRLHDMAGRRRSVPAGASANRSARGLDWCLAVLYPAPIRAHRMGRRRNMEPAGGGASRQLPLCPAEPFALVHCQYRHSPHPSFVQPHPLLPTAAGATRPSGPRRHRPADPASESQVRATGAMGRRSATARLSPRGAPALCFDLTRVAPSLFGGAFEALSLACKTASTRRLISRPPPCALRSTPYLTFYGQVAACPRAAQKTAIYRSFRSLQWRRWCHRLAQKNTKKKRLFSGSETNPNFHLPATFGAPPPHFPREKHGKRLN